MPFCRNMLLGRAVVSVFLLLVSASGCTGDAAQEPSGGSSDASADGGASNVEAKGEVNVFWSGFPTGARPMVAARFMKGPSSGCTERALGPCRETKCASAVASISAGTIRVRGTAPPFALDVPPLDGAYSASGDALVGAQLPSASADSQVQIAAAGSADVPAFDMVIPYPELLVLTAPPVDDPVTAPSTPMKRIVVPRSQPTRFSWTGGSTDVSFRVEGVAYDSSSGSSRSVACEAASTAGALDVPAGALEGLSLRAFTVATRTISAGGWTIDMRVAGQALVRSGPSGTALYAADLGGR